MEIIIKDIEIGKMMTEKQKQIEFLMDLATEAFAAIASNTQLVLWHPTDGSENSLNSALIAFENAMKDHGLPWIIDSSVPTGLTHLGLGFWMEEASQLIEPI